MNEREPDHMPKSRSARNSTPKSKSKKSGRSRAVRSREYSSSGDTPSSSPQKVGIPPRKLYKIGEVIQYSGISRQTIHNYTMLGLITEEERTESGHRLYGEEVFERLSQIENLKKRKRTLKEIRRILHEKGKPGRS